MLYNVEFGIECHQYVNDAQLSLSFPSQSREVVEVQNLYLKTMKGWLRMSQLKLNPDQMEVLLIGGWGNADMGLFWILLYTP